ncbi:MAG TPA: acyl carrier protein [Micromonosporaceae bacterium]|jgi:acyl carrier protein
MTQSTDIERATVVAAVTKALEETLGRELPDIDESTRLFDDLAIDSTGVLGVLIALEDELDLEIDPDTITEEHFATVGGLTDCSLAALKNR